MLPFRTLALLSVLFASQSLFGADEPPPLTSRKTWLAKPQSDRPAAPDAILGKTEAAEAATLLWNNGAAKIRESRATGSLAVLQKTISERGDPKLVYVGGVAVETPAKATD